VIREFSHIERSPTYTLPFTPQNADNLYKQRNGKCKLSISDDMKGEMVVSVDSLDTFKLPMDEIWEIRRRALAGDRITQ
jgi:hypothetical protein